MPKGREGKQVAPKSFTSFFHVFISEIEKVSYMALVRKAEGLSSRLTQKHKEKRRDS
jgi:hypothetical protein